MPEVKIKVAAGTDVGLVRNNNEDNFIVSSNLADSDWLIPQTDKSVGLGELGALLVVADGMGGANAGEVASAIAIDTIQDLFSPEHIEAALANDKTMQDFMKEVVQQADLNIIGHSHNNAATQGMGTTIVSAWLHNDKAYICWCGDSRCYVLNRQRGLTQLSKDHSYVQELVDKGELSRETMHDHPLSNVITRCLGDEDRRAQPETLVYQLHDGDVIMLCSDGLCGICSDQEIQDVMSEHHDDAAACKDELLSLALVAGGYDNVTVVTCAIEMDEPDVADGSDGTFVSDGTTMTAGETQQEADELSATLQAKPHRRKRYWLLLIVILVVTLALVCLAVRPEFETFRHYLTDFVKTHGLP